MAHTNTLTTIPFVDTDSRESLSRIHGLALHMWSSGVETRTLLLASPCPISNDQRHPNPQQQFPTMPPSAATTEQTKHTHSTPPYQKPTKIINKDSPKSSPSKGWTSEELVNLFRHVSKNGTQSGKRGWEVAVPGRTANQSYQAWL